MARQIPTMAELTQVSNDFETFFLPFDASLDLGTRTVYGTTDPAVDLSMVNVRHLNNTRGFRGVWTTAPADGNEPAPYLTGQVVIDSNGLIYRRNATNPATNPDPEMTGQTEWDLIGREVTVTNQDSSATIPPGLSTTESGNTRTITFSRYRGGNGVDVNNTTGEISVTNFSLTDVHTFTTVALRNAANMIEWHIGDIAIVTGDTDNGQGTYVYTGTTNGNDYTGTTVAADWVLLALPGNVVTSVADTVGPTVTTQNIVDAINADTFTDGQVLTEAQATRVGSRYSGAGAPANNFASGTRLTGDVYVDTTNENFYFFDGTLWRQANPATLDDVGDVTITTPLENNLISRNGTNQWVNVTPTDVADNIALGNLQDVTIGRDPQNNDHLVYNGTDWVNRTPAEVSAAEIDLDDLRDVIITGDSTITYSQARDSASQPIFLDDPRALGINTAGTTLTFTNAFPASVDFSTSFNLLLRDSQDSDFNTPHPTNDMIGVTAANGISQDRRTVTFTTAINQFTNFSSVRFTGLNQDLYAYTSTTTTEPVAANSLIEWNGTAWINQTTSQVANSILLEDLSDVDRSPTVGDLLIRTAETGTNRWDHESIAQIISGANHGVGATLENLTNVADGAPTTGDLLRYDGTNWVRIATLDGGQITDNTITGAKLIADTITAREIGPNAVTASELADNAVDTAAIVDLNVTTDKIANDAITNAKLADNAVQTDNITDLNVTRGKIAADAIDNSKLADNSVQTENISMNAVTNDKVADDAIGLAELADPTGLNAGDRRIFIYSQDTGAWAYVAPEEQAIGSIFDIGDVQRQQELTPVVFTLPAAPADVRLQLAQVTQVDSGETPPDSTVAVTLMDAAGISVGDRIGFVNAAGTASETNGPQGYNVDSINPSTNVIVISDIDGGVIPVIVRENIGASQIGEEKFVFLFTRTGGEPEAIQNGEIMAYNSMSQMWENTEAAELSLITDLQVGEGSNQQSIPVSDTGQGIILEATPERDGAMSSEDKLKLDNIPTAPTTVAGNTEPTVMDPNITLGDTEHYALSVERTSNTGPAEYEESWINISEIVTSGGSPLIWRDAADTNSTDLVQYRQGAAIRNIVGTQFSGNFLRLSLGVFTPTLNDGTLSRSWDQPANAIIASVTNPPGVDQFISSVDAITLDSGNAQTLTDFTPGTMTPTAGPDVDWTQPFTLTTGNIFDNNTGTAGGTTIATITFNERTGTGPEARYAPDTSTYSINWGSVSATSPSASLARSNINFYERVTSVAITQSLFGLRTASNGSITWTRGAGLTGGTLTGTTRLNSTFTLGSPVYKDSRTIAADATVASSVIATRPATVTGTEYMQTLSTATSNRPAITSVTMPFFRLTTDAITTVPTPYGPDDGILTGDFDTGDGLTLAPGILRSTSISGLNLGSATARVNVPADTFYWFGRQGTTAPTIQVDTGVGLQDPVGTVTQTVTFDNSFTNAPSGWTNVTYTFIGVSINAGPTYINVT